MNTDSQYRRHGYQPPKPPEPPEPPAPQPEAGADLNELARHRDPSLTTGTGAGTGTRTGSATGSVAITHKHVAWVRPTELASYVGPRVGPGIDLHAELVRRALRTPVTTTRAMRRPAPTNPSPNPSPAASRSEGLQP